MTASGRSRRARTVANGASMAIIGGGVLLVLAGFFAMVVSADSGWQDISLPTMPSLCGIAVIVIGTVEVALRETGRLRSTTRLLALRLPDIIASLGLAAVLIHLGLWRVGVRFGLALRPGWWYGLLGSIVVLVGGLVQGWATRGGRVYMDDIDEWEDPRVLPVRSARVEDLTARAAFVVPVVALVLLALATVTPYLDLVEPGRYLCLGPTDCAGMTDVRVWHIDAPFPLAAFPLLCGAAASVTSLIDLLVQRRAGRPRRVSSLSAGLAVTGSVIHVGWLLNGPADGWDWALSFRLSGAALLLVLVGTFLTAPPVDGGGKPFQL